MSFKNLSKNKISLFKILITLLLITLHIFLVFVIKKNNSNNQFKRHSQDIFSRSHKTFIEAHRGVVKEVFQNTLESFQKVLKYNIESLETDAWLSKDKVLILLHGSQY